MLFQEFTGEIILFCVCLWPLSVGLFLEVLKLNVLNAHFFSLCHGGLILTHACTIQEYTDTHTNSGIAST